MTNLSTTEGLTETLTKTSIRSQSLCAALLAVGLSSGCEQGQLSTAHDTNEGTSGGGTYGTGATTVSAGNSGGSVSGTLAGSTGSAGSPWPSGSSWPSSNVVMFVPDDLASVVYRYSIASGSDPVLDGTIPVTSGYSVALRSTGELFVSSYASQTISRFLAPFSAPVSNGTLTIDGVSVIRDFGIEDMVFVDDALWATSPATSMVVFMSFSANHATLAGAQGNLPSGAGVVWDSAARIFYVSQRPPNGGTVQPYHIGSDHMPTQLATITGNGLNGPDGMVLTSWGELLVANYYANTVSRFSIDSQGRATANSTITGNGLFNPAGMALAPWGELFVANQGSGTVSRFTFDASHAPVANGTFQTSCKANPGGTSSNESRMNWIAIFSQTPTTVTGIDGSAG